MKPIKDDRRSRRTRQLIGDALVELLLEKRFEDITVQDILERADVGRTTFYAHYMDKEDLLMSEIEHLFHRMADRAQAAGGSPHGMLPSLELFRHVQEQRRLMQAFAWSKSDVTHPQNLQRWFKSLIEENLRSLVGETVPTAFPVPVLAGFIAGTFMMLLQWWFDEGMTQTPEEIDDMFQRLVMPAIHDAIA